MSWIGSDTILVKNGLVYNTDNAAFEAADVLIKDGIIAKVGRISDCDEAVFDARGAKIIPGLIDVHTHGRAGYDFVSCSEEELHELARSYAAIGVCSVMPTVASAPWEDMLAAVERINNFVPNPDEASFLGVHLEGRFLNPQKRGAHAPELLTPFDPQALDSCIFKACKRLHISAAYELDDGEFMEKALSIGATLGLGHTNATYEHAKRIEGRGLSSYTHLYNAMPALHHRDGGAVCAALEGDCFAELICDGIHVSPQMIRLAYLCKGAERITLITDSMEATDCPDGEYFIAGNPVIVKDGIARTQDGALAGSTLELFFAVKNLSDFCNIPFEKALLCATAIPASQVGAYEVHGSIDIGKSADMLVLDGQGNISKIILRGNILSC